MVSGTGQENNSCIRPVFSCSCDDREREYGSSARATRLIHECCLGVVLLDPSYDAGGLLDKLPVLHSLSEMRTVKFAVAFRSTRLPEG